MCCKVEVEDCKTKETPQKIDKGPFIGMRHIQSALLFLMMTLSLSSRVNLSVAMVAMTNRTTENPHVPVYDWDDKSITLSSFFWGYVVTQVPAAQLIKRYGSKWFVISSTFLDAIACLVIPQVADLAGSKGVMACRVIQGLAQGFLYPAVHTLLGSWAPPQERSTLGTFVYTGSITGCVLAMPITGIISESWYGWPLAFYVFGSLELLWVVSFMMLGSDSPSSHKKITFEEKFYIEKSLGQEEKQSVSYTPWKSILKSLPFWALFIVNAGINFGQAIFSMESPTYINKILKFDISSSSILSAAPYLAMWITSFIFGPLCDYLINEGYCSRGACRKIFNTIGTISPAIVTAVLGYIPPENAIISVTLLILNGCFISAMMCGFQVNHIDLSPRHAGTLMGCTNGLTNVFAIIAPLVVQFIVTDETDLTQWRIVFLTASFIYVSTNLVFVLFGSGELQDWNDEQKPEKKLEKPQRF